MHRYKSGAVHGVLCPLLRVGLEYDWGEAQVNLFFSVGSKRLTDIVFCGTLLHGKGEDSDAGGTFGN